MRQKWLLRGGKTLTFAHIFAWLPYTTNSRKSWSVSMEYSTKYSKEFCARL